jgi:predicted metal-dependent peptidase
MIKNVLKISKELLYDYPFYGSVLLSLQKEINNRITKTACVGLNGIMYKLSINSDFWDTLIDDHKQGLLIHELGHIINFHPTEYRHLDNHKIANIAMDIYINQGIPENLLPPKACTWEKYKDLNKGWSTNQYYDKLMENHKDESDEALENAIKAMQQGEGEADDGNGGTMQVPQHTWEEITEASEAVQKMLSKNTEILLNEVVKTMSDPGNIPAGITDLLARLGKIEPPKYNWRAFMKRFVGTSTRVDVKKTRRKKSKRFVGMAGSKEQYYSNILVAIDTSLSVNQAELEEFQNEIYHMHRTGHDVEIVLCDTEIHDHFKYNPREPLKVTGRGGTAFQPVIDLYNKNQRKYSCLIYLTDGEAYAPQDARGNILWVHSSVSEINENLPGKCIKLN